MNKHHPYKNIIERKLEQLPTPDADLLWNDMHSILDKKMPQKKERRRFIFWFLTRNGLLTLAFLLIAIISSSLFLLSAKKSSPGLIKKLPGSVQSNKSIENGTTKVFQERKENITTVSKSNKKTKNNISATAPSASAPDYVTDNNLVSRQTIKQSKKYKATGQFNQSIPGISNDRENLDIATVNLKSIQQDFPITTKHSEEKDPLNHQPEPTTNNVKLKKRNANESGFYWGIITGVDLSSIHFQSVKTGSTKGFIIGYALNKKWSIESGLLWDTKRVYDNGSYFKPAGYTPTNGITIVAVNGKSRLYELPVNIKYTIIPGKHGLFTTAGLSSYLMRSENYDYEYMQNNQPGGHNYLNYTTEVKNWFSVVNFSLGYTYKLGDLGKIRVEPYLRIPIKNIGAGNMPVMSTGLNIGFTKTLR